MIQGNKIGTDVTGTFTVLDGKSTPGFELGNQQNGILLLNASTETSVVVKGNMIGGAGSTGETTDEENPALNLISGNQLNGIAMEGADVQNNFIEGNEIGTDKSGTHALGNVNAGIFLNSTVDSSGGPSGNQIGGTDALAGNLISGNGQPAVKGGTPGNGDAIVIAGDSNANIVLANSIGTDVTGDTGLPNTGNGVVIDDSRENTIGGSVSGAGNLISGNFSGDGVVIRDAHRITW